MLIEDVTLAGEVLRRTTHEVPVLGESGCSAQRPSLPAATDADRRLRALDRLRLVAGTAELVVLALEGRRLLREEPDDHLTSLLEAVAALGRRAQLDPVGPRLLLVPAGPDPEFQTPAGNNVEGGRHVGENAGWR